MASFNSLKSQIFDKEERKQQYQAHIRGLNAYDRHKKFLNDYDIHSYTYLVFMEKTSLQSGSSLLKRIMTLLEKGTEEDDMDTSWEQRLVKRYYDKLFKEWRTEKEVMSGKGQFICGNRYCDEKDRLASYEVTFSYFEAGENKQALVKLAVCERCAEKYKNRKEKERLLEREKEEHRKNGSVMMPIFLRERYDSDSDNEGKERRKDKKASVSEVDHDDNDDDNFDEYLKGMFP